MPADIAVLDGKAQAWYEGKPAWHGLGEVSQGAKTARQVERAVPAFRKPIELAPVYMKIGNRMVEASGYRATHRRGDTVPLGIVTDEYVAMNDGDGLLILEAIVAAARRSSFVSAGLLGRGERAFASIDLSRVVDLRIKRDPSRQESHCFGTWAHDGSGALRVGLWNNRVECQNMLNMALAYSEGRGLLVRITHIGDMAARLREAQGVLGFVEKVAKAHAAELNALADVPLPKGYIAPYLSTLIPIPEDMERSGSREEARAVIASLFKSSKTLVGVPESPYRLYQATAEYADHWRPLRVGEAAQAVVSERRFRAITEGPAADLKARGLELLRQEFLVPNAAIPATMP